jgi:heme exporter protein D
MIKFLRSIPEYATEFFARYPAVLSGYIIYCYLFISIMRLFYKVKHQGATYVDAYDIFSALPFMWLLAVSLVKVIEYRTKIHQNETQQLAREKELQMKDTQLKTMHEVVKGLQHQINNPLAIIALLISKTKKSVKDNQDAIKNIESIEQSANSIAHALEDFKRAEFYEIDNIGSLEGKIAAIPKEP